MSRKRAINTSTLMGIIAGFNSDKSLFNIVAALSFLKFCSEQATIEIEDKQAAALLVMLYHRTGGEFTVGIAYDDLQLDLTPDQLDDVIRYLLDLGCIRKENNRIYLNERVILLDVT